MSLLVGWLIGKLSGENAEYVGAWFLILSALFLGLPHGAYDFFILKDTVSSERRNFLSLIKQLSIYLSTVFLIIAFWIAFPNLALISFLALSVWHFGSGDAIWEFENKKTWILNSLGRGLILIFAPLTFFPRESGEVLSTLVRGTNATSVNLLINLAPFFLLFGIAVTLVSPIVFITKNSSRLSEKNLVVLIETVLLLLFFCLTTPLLAVTVYLLGVHSWRHLLRLNLYETEGKSIENPNTLKFVTEFHLRVLPISIFSLIGIGLIFWLWQFRVSDLANYTSAYLILLSALTVPHAILITLTEFRHQNAKFIS